MGLNIPTRDTVVASPDGRYRYLTYRQVQGGDPLKPVCYITPRPEAAEDGRVVRRCVDLARSWGAGEVLVVHAFSLLAADVGDLVADGDPVGPDTDAWVATAALHATRFGGEVVCAWGNGGSLLDRDRTILRLLADADVRPMSLGTDRHGFPLTVAKGGGLRPYAGREEHF